MQSTIKISAQCQDEKSYDCVEGDDSNKSIKGKSIACSNQECIENNFDMLTKMLASSSLGENNVGNSQAPDLILNASPSVVHRIVKFNNLTVKTDDRQNDVKKPVLVNVPVETNNRPKNAKKSVAEELLKSIPNVVEKAAALKILNSRLSDLRDTSLLHKMLNTENEGHAIDDIINSYELGFNDKDKMNVSLTYGGGGDPAKYFFDNLVRDKGTLKISDLLTVLDDHNVLYEYVEKKSETISKLNYDWIIKLCVQLNYESKWRDVASSLQYGPLEISHFQLTQKRDNNYSPAYRLFSLIKSRKPEFSVENFMNILKRLELESIYQHMASMVRKTAAKTAEPVAQNKFEEPK